MCIFYTDSYALFLPLCAHPWQSNQYNIVSLLSTIANKQAILVSWSCDRLSRLADGWSLEVWSSAEIGPYKCFGHMSPTIVVTKWSTDTSRHLQTPPHTSGHLGTNFCIWNAKTIQISIVFDIEMQKCRNFLTTMSQVGPDLGLIWGTMRPMSHFHFRNGSILARFRNMVLCGYVSPPFMRVAGL